MFEANNVSSTLRALTLDELDLVSGGKGKKADYIVVERCTTTIGSDGREVQKCKVVSDTMP
jgi:hypothetical protein